MSDFIEKDTSVEIAGSKPRFPFHGMAQLCHIEGSMVIAV
jgi:hypothetical protein